MSEVFVVRLDPVAPASLRWRSERLPWQSGSYHELATALGEDSCVLLIDGAAVTLMITELPVTDLKTARQAAPYAVEERLAQPLDDLHFAVQALGSGTFAVAVIARAHIENLTRDLMQAGIRPRVITAAYYALPYAEDTWSIQVEDGSATVRLARHAGLKVDLSEMSALVPLLRREYPATARVVIYSDDPPLAFPQPLFQGLQLEWRPLLNAADLLAELAQRPPPILLDASQSAHARARGRRLWRLAAGAAAALALAYPALLGLHNSVLAHKDDELAAANRAILIAAFPDITRVVNPRVQADQALAALRGAAVKTPRFLDLLAEVDTARASRFPPGTQVSHASFGNGVLELGIETLGMDAVELVRSILKEAGMSADTLSAEAADDKIIARLRVMEGS